MVMSSGEDSTQLLSSLLDDEHKVVDCVNTAGRFKRCSLRGLSV